MSGRRTPVNSGGMVECDWTEKFELQGEERKRALKIFLRTLKGWDIKMPPAKPLVLDFGLGKFPEVGLIEFWVANEEKEGYCGKFLFVFDGQQCPSHRHNIKHETFFVVKGSVTMKIDGKNITRNAGDILVIPTGVRHSFTGRGDALLLEVSAPCRPGDSFFDNKGIGRKGII